MKIKKLLSLLLVLIFAFLLPSCAGDEIFSGFEQTETISEFENTAEFTDEDLTDDFSDEEDENGDETQSVYDFESTTEKYTAKSSKKTTTEKRTSKSAEKASVTEKKAKIDKNGKYNSKDEVALYIHTYGTLPGNYITKKEAQALGWSGGSLKNYAPGCSIGGDYFGNYEGILPKKQGRKYTECDIDTADKSSRGAKRIIFSNDGLIFYTEDHYETFVRLY